MAFSCTDFTDSILNYLIGKGLLSEDEYHPDDPESQCAASIAAIDKLAALAGYVVSTRASPTPAGHGVNGQNNSVCFMQELLAANETLSAIGEIRGILTLADCMYMLSAIQKGTYIDFCQSSESQILEVVQELPSAAIWMTYIHQMAE